MLHVRNQSCHKRASSELYGDTSSRGGKTVNDRLNTRCVDILIRFVALLDRLAGPAPAFRRIPANGPRSVLPAKLFWRAVARRFRPDGCWPGKEGNWGRGGRQIGLRGIGSARCRERACQYVLSLGAGSSLK